MNAKDFVTIFLVDDNEVDVMGVQRALRKSNIENPIAIAGNGLEALNKLREGLVSEPYLILLDLNMPCMNGIEFLQNVRQDEKLRKSVVFILTTSDAPEDRSKAYDHNIAGYIVKGETSSIDAAGLLDRYMQACTLP